MPCSRSTAPPTCPRLGVNAVLPLSVVCLTAAAAPAGEPLWRFALDATQPKIELPMPMINIVSGGAHAGRALDIQDVLVVPIAAEAFSQALEWVDPFNERNTSCEPEHTSCLRHLP
jgi:enolase